MNNCLKEALNMMQYHIDRNSPNILLIFDNDYLKRNYMETIKEKNTNEICISTNDLCYTNTLSGLKFKAFYFMR